MSEALVKVEKLHKSFADQEVLRGIDIEIFPEQLTVLMGASGCGKSTLLRCLNGLEDFDSGRVKVLDVDIKREVGCAPCTEKDRERLRSGVGMVFQNFNLFPHLNLLDNLTVAPRVVGKISPTDARDRALGLLEKVGLSSFVDRFPHQLSGGQQQRAAIARALAMSPRVMLYDEPTSALDPSLVDEVLQVMRRLHEEGMTQIVVTHEMRFARDVSDWVVYMESGRVCEMGESRELFKSPRNDRTRHFLRNYL